MRPPLLALGLCLAAALVPCATAMAAPSACSDVPDIPTAVCGSVEVPLDRAHPSAGTTSVAYLLLPHRDTSAPSAGTLLFNPGGPGAASIANAAPIAEQFAPLLDTRDLLLVDPRGIGRSTPLSCPAFSTVALADVFAPRERFLERTGACGRQLGARAGQYGTAAVADDFDAVRAALGVDRLDLWGNSYGTYLMPVYAARHPQHVRSMVLSGAYPIDFDPWGRDRLAAARRGLGVVCARAGSCRGDAVLRDVAALATRLRNHPETFTVAANERRFAARVDEDALASLLYTGGNPYTLGTLPGLVASGRAGDLAPLRRVVETNLLTTAYSVSQGATGDLAQAFATICHDYPRAFSLADPPAVRRMDFEAARAAIDPRAFYPLSAAAWSHAGFEGSDSCIDWPNDPTAGRPIAPGTPMPDVPVLVISGELDANTPSAAGRELAAEFAHGAFVEIPNAGHVPTDSSPCALAAGLRFVATTTADAQACDGTGTPPPVAPAAALRVADLTPVQASASPAQRRALAVVVATATDMQTQAGLLGMFSPVSALRGGTYERRGEQIGLVDARVVLGASASGELAVSDTAVTGTLRLSGPAVADGRLQVELRADGHGRATGNLDGHRVDLGFRYGG